MNRLVGLVVASLLVSLTGCCKRSSSASASESGSSPTTTTPSKSDAEERAQKTRDECQTNCNLMFRDCPNKANGIPACVSVCLPRPSRTQSCYSETMSMYGAAKCQRASACMVAAAK